MLRRSRSATRSFNLLFCAIASATVMTACGRTLGSMVNETMDGCIAERNPVFKSGAGATALNTPLPKTVSDLAKRIAYKRALDAFEQYAETAADQVTLVCALELASYYKHGDVAVMIWKYIKHPDAGVSVNAKRLLGTQDPLPVDRFPVE
jgi:hypothetical protein